MEIRTWYRGGVKLFLALGLVVSLWLVMSASAVKAQGGGPQVPILEDNFEYGAESKPLNQVTSNWNVHSSSTNRLLYTPTVSLSMPGYEASGFGGAVYLQAGATGDDLNRKFITQTDTTVYYAALVKITSATTSGDYFLHFMQTTTAFYGRLYVKRDSSNNLAFGIARATETPIIYTSPSYALNTVYLLVVKVDLTTGASSLFVLTAPVETEPAPTVTATGTGAISNVNAIGIRQGGATTTPAGFVDGIRVATSWAGLFDQQTQTVSTPGNTYSFPAQHAEMYLNSGDAGRVTIAKIRYAPGGNPPDPQEMPIMWSITSTNSPFNVDLKLCYTDAELGTLNEANLVAYRWTGTGWESKGGTVDTTNNCVTVADVTQFSTWTLGVSTPNRVSLTTVRSRSSWAPLSLVLLILGAGLMFMRRK